MVATIAYAFIAGRQLFLIDKQIDVMQDTLSEMIPNVAAVCRSGLASGPQRSIGLVNPGAGILLTLNTTGGKPLPGELEDSIGAGKVLYVYGCISYQDTFHAFHWLNFRSPWDKGRKEYGVCEKYNNAGDGAMNL
jgi:hypothetical protein